MTRALDRLAGAGLGGADTAGRERLGMSGTTGTDGEDDRLLHRMLFFSDAVFAIVLTLLVLDLRPPEARDAASLNMALSAMSGHFVAFGLSFGVVAIFWTAHMSTLRQLRRFDWPTAWMNLAFLAPICLMPFASALAGQARFDAAAWEVYCLDLMVVSAANVALVLVASRGGGRLMGGVATGQRVHRAVRAAAPGIAFSAGYVAARAGWGHLAQFCWLLIPVVFLLSRLALRPERTPSAEPPPTVS